MTAPPPLPGKDAPDRVDRLLRAEPLVRSQTGAHGLSEARVGYQSALRVVICAEAGLIMHAVLRMALEAEIRAMKPDRTTIELDYRWHLRELMAARGMFSTTDLRPLLAERGIELSQSQVYRLVAEKPERLNLRTLMALLDILECAITDLIEPLPTRKV